MTLREIIEAKNEQTNGSFNGNFAGYYQGMTDEEAAIYASYVNSLEDFETLWENVDVKDLM